MTEYIAATIALGIAGIFLAFWITALIQTIIKMIKDRRNK